MNGSSDDIQDAQGGKEVHKERSVKILTQLVQNKPVSSWNTLDVSLYYFLFGIDVNISEQTKLD